jgi:3-methyladenine DNA glycosylase AlkD
MKSAILYDIDELTKRCEALADKAYLKNTLALIPTDWKMIGVRTANIRKLASEYAVRINRKEDFDELIAYLDEAFDRKNLTLVALGFEILNKRSKFLERKVLENIKMWVPLVSDWAVADGMSISITGSLLEKNLISLNDLSFLKDHPNIFGRRIYITSMVLPIRKDTSDINLFLSEIKHFIPDKNKYIYKAVSWVLREGTKKFKTQISAFLEWHSEKLHSSVVREVRNKIETGKKYG